VDDALGLMVPAKQLLHVGWSIADVNQPGKQLEHMASDDKLQAENTYSPTLHVRHELQLKRFDVFVKVLVVQLAHKALAVALQLLDILCPGTQSVQFKHALIPVFGAYVFAGHAWKVVDPGRQNFPTRQSVCVAVVTQKLPALHRVILYEPIGQYVPLSHVVGAVEPAAHQDLMGQTICTDVLLQ
jgi:hypothetical protein